MEAQYLSLWSRHKICLSLSISLIILFTNVQNKIIYTYIKVQWVKESNRGKLNSHIKTALQNEKIKQLRIEN